MKNLSFEKKMNLLILVSILINDFNNFGYVHRNIAPDTLIFTSDPLGVKFRELSLIHRVG